MVPLAYAALAAWIVLGPLLFAVMRDKRHAVLVIFIAGFLFLPEIHETQATPESPACIAIRPFFLIKANAMAYGFLAGLFCFDLRRLLAFRPRWFDWPMILWCLVPFFSGMANSDVIADAPPGKALPIRPIPAVINAIQQTMAWGVPYLAGRLYFNDLASFQLLARGLLLGGLAYAPLCLVEKVVSPQLHKWVYGFHPHDFSQAIRDGYRPWVFLEHGLMTAMWMVASALLAVWLWWTRSLEDLPWLKGRKPVPMGLVVVLILVATVLMKSTGALALGLVGAAVLFLSPVAPVRVALALLISIAPLYIVGRTVGAREPTGWPNILPEDNRIIEELERRAMRKPFMAYSSVTLDDIYAWMTENFNKERSEFKDERFKSMLFRFKQEDKLMQKSLQRPWLGWGGEGRARIFDVKGTDQSVTDGLWILVLGDRGFVGLGLMCAAILLPAARFVWTYPPRLWSHPALAAAAVVAVVLVLSMIDDIANAMVDPLFILASGALAGVTGIRPAAKGTEDAPPAGTAPAAPQRRAVATRRLGQPSPETHRPGVLQRRLPSAGRLDAES